MTFTSFAGFTRIRDASRISSLVHRQQRSQATDGRQAPGGMLAKSGTKKNSNSIGAFTRVLMSCFSTGRCHNASSLSFSAESGCRFASFQIAFESVVSYRQQASAGRSRVLIRDLWLFDYSSTNRIRLAIRARSRFVPIDLPA